MLIQMDWSFAEKYACIHNHKLIAIQTKFIWLNSNKNSRDRRPNNSKQLDTDDSHEVLSK